MKGATGPDEVKGVLDLWQKVFAKYVSKITAAKVDQVTETTKGLVKSAVAAGQDAGEGVTATAKRIADAYSGFAGYRSELIARTEVLGAQGAASRLAAISTGLKLNKEWIHSGAAHPRDWHEAMNGETVGIDEPYSNGLMFPGDPDGPPEEICNCGCLEAQIPVRDDDGAVMRADD